MAKEITLPSGNTVRMREPETLLKKDRDKVGEIAGNAENDFMQATLMADAFIAISVIDWSFDLIPPAIRIASIGELTPKDYDALAAEAIKGADYLFPNVNLTEENEKDPKADTANSND